MATKYAYSITGDFPNQKVAPDLLTQEIDDSSITTSLDYINTDLAGAGVCDIWFTAPLSGPEETTLDAVVAAHTGIPALCIPRGTPGWNLRIEDRDLTAPPGSPEVNEFYIVADSATGAWAGHDGQVAGWNGTAWQFLGGSPGLAAWVSDENVVVVYENDTEKWRSYGTPDFGKYYQYEESVARSSTTSTTYQTKVTLTTPALTGTFRVSWVAAFDMSSTGGDCYVRCYNETDGDPVGGDARQEVSDTDEVVHVGAFETEVFTGASKTFKLQWCRGAASSITVGLQYARIDVWQVS